jgi:hypothetical protein
LKTKKCLSKSKLKNNKGMATLEAIPLIVIFVMLVGYALGLWGVVHSATLHSIGARQYAFATLRNRANYTFHRDNGGDVLHNKKIGYRYHAITINKGSDFEAPILPITVGKKPANTDLQNLNTTNQQMHYDTLFDLQKRNQTVEFSHAWIMAGYGICLNPVCGAPE